MPVLIFLLCYNIIDVIEHSMGRLGLGGSLWVSQGLAFENFGEKKIDLKNSAHGLILSFKKKKY